MPFTTRGAQVDLTDDHGVLLAPLSYQGSVEHFVVPSGFETDFATVPRVLRSLVPSIGKWTRAAILHDWFCVHLRTNDCVVTARQADGIFRRVMREDGVGLVIRWLMFVAVRWAALANPHRRGGWWRDAAPVVAITVVTFITAAIAITGLDYLVHALIGWL